MLNVVKAYAHVSLNIVVIPTMVAVPSVYRIQIVNLTRPAAIINVWIHAQAFVEEMQSVMLSIIFPCAAVFLIMRVILSHFVSPLNVSSDMNELLLIINSFIINLFI